MSAGLPLRFFSPSSAFLVDLGVRGVTRLDGALRKKQV